MPTLTGLTTNFFATPNEGFTTTTSGPVDSSSDTVVPFNSVSGLTNGSIFTGLIDPGNAKERAFTGVVDTGGSQITSVKFTTGTNATHTTGATIVDYVTGTHIGAMTKGILNHSDQDGTLKAGAVDVTAVLADSIVTKDKLSTAFELEHDTGWNLSYAGTTLAAPNTITNNGNRSYDMVFNSVDYTNFLSEGQRLRLTRTVSAPTYMGGLFNGSSHYFTKATCTSTLSTVTNNFSIKATIEPTAYQDGYICGRSDAAANNAIGLKMEANGRISINVFNGGVSNYRAIATYQSVPLNKKTKIWVSWTSGTVVIKFDGITVPIATAITGGTAPTTAGTGGDWSIGRMGAFASVYFAGYINDVGVFDAVITPTVMLSLDSQALLGSETNCIGAWSLNNTGVNQQAAGTNDLTATGGVSYTVRSPYGNYLGGTLEYAIITKTAFSTNTTLTVQVPEGCAIPTSGGVSAVAYATSGTPYGFPADEGRWDLIALYKTSPGNLSNTSVAQVTGHQLLVPVGGWRVGGSITALLVSASLGASSDFAISASTSVIDDASMSTRVYVVVGGQVHSNDSYVEKGITLSSATNYYLVNIGTNTPTMNNGATANHAIYIIAKCALL